MSVYGPDKSEKESKEELQEKKTKAIIEKYILDNLGRPKNYYQTQVKPLWANFYRVNIVIAIKEKESMVVEYSISDSFFMKLEEGEVVTCEPKIQRRYK